MAPVLVTLLPPALAISAVGSFGDGASGITAWSLGGVAWLAVSVLLSQLGRDAGKRKEQLLFAAWGGTPTTILLRHHSGLADVPSLRMNAQALQHSRELIGKLLPELPLPTPAQEHADPAAADARYAAVVAALRARTSDTDMYRMLFTENCGYGFRRNLWAMRAVGLLLAGASTLVLTVRFALDEGHQSPITAPLGIACLLLTVWWAARINTGWVKVAAFEYAQQLMMATHIMSHDATSK